MGPDGEAPVRDGVVSGRRGARLRLLAITPGDGRLSTAWLDAIGRGGVSGVLIREPALDRATLDDRVRAALDAVPFVAVHVRNPHADDVAARWSVALHTPAGAPRTGAGASAHDEAEVDAALAAGARYVLLSPVWTPTSKPDDARPPLGLDRFLAVAAGRPVLALGGVTPERFRVLQGAGAGAAILGPLAADPAEVSATLARWWS